MTKLGYSKSFNSLGLGAYSPKQERRSKRLEQNLKNKYWSEKTVFKKLKNLIIPAFEEILKISKNNKIDFRTASYVLALKRLEKDYKKAN